MKTIKISMANDPNGNGAQVGRWMSEKDYRAMNAVVRAAKSCQAMCGNSNLMVKALNKIYGRKP